MAPTPMKGKGMKGAGAKPLTKGAIAEKVAEATEIKKSVAAQAIAALAEIATKEVGKTGKFTIAGLCMLKLRTKPATKAGKKEIFGKIVMVKAKPARKVVKALPVKALKDSI